MISENTMFLKLRRALIQGRAHQRPCPLKIFSTACASFSILMMKAMENKIVVTKKKNNKIEASTKNFSIFILIF